MDHFAGVIREESSDGVIYSKAQETAAQLPESNQKKKLDPSFAVSRLAICLSSWFFKNLNARRLAISLAALCIRVTAPNSRADSFSKRVFTACLFADSFTGRTELYSHTYFQFEKSCTLYLRIITPLIIL